MIGWIAGALFCTWGVIAHMKLYLEEISRWPTTPDTVWNGITGIMNFVTVVVYLVLGLICVYKLIM